MTLNKGVTQLAPTFIGRDFTATPYYVYVTHKPHVGWQTPAGMGIPVYDPNYGRVPPQKKKRQVPTVRQSFLETRQEFRLHTKRIHDDQEQSTCTTQQHYC